MPIPPQVQPNVVVTENEKGILEAVESLQEVLNSLHEKVDVIQTQLGKIAGERG